MLNGGVGEGGSAGRQDDQAPSRNEMELLNDFMKRQDEERGAFFEYSFFHLRSSSEV